MTTIEQISERDATAIGSNPSAPDVGTFLRDMSRNLVAAAAIAAIFAFASMTSEEGQGPERIAQTKSSGVIGN
ncbi:MAG: hypothetical protein AAGH38_11955 [Pseudomonadota bacterium]